MYNSGDELVAIKDYSWDDSSGNLFCTGDRFKVFRTTEDGGVVIQFLKFTFYFKTKFIAEYFKARHTINRNLPEWF